MNKFELIDQAVNTVYNWVYNAEQCSAQRTKTVGTDDLKKLLDMLHQIELKTSDFADDREKMLDFDTMSKEKFLESYSYLTEEEYDNTKLIRDAGDAHMYEKWWEQSCETNHKLRDAISHGHCRELRPGEWAERKDDLEYLFVVQEAWGDRTFYFDWKTRDVLSTWCSIGD